MTGAFRDAPTSAAKPIKPEASHTKSGRALLQLSRPLQMLMVTTRFLLLMMIMMMMMMMMMMMGDKVPPFYIYKFPIVRFSGCYWY